MISLRSTRQSRSVRNRQGFTLIEIMAALAVLGIALFILMESHYGALNLHAIMEEEVIMRHFLESTVGKAEIAILQGTLSESGDFGARFPDYTWSFEGSPVEEAGEMELFDVNVTVTGPGNEQRTLEFLVYNTGVEQT